MKLLVSIFLAGLMQGILNYILPINLEKLLVIILSGMCALIWSRIDTWL